MKHFNAILNLAAVAAGAALRASSEPGPPLPLGELGWEGSITPGGPVVKVWGESFDVSEAPESTILFLYACFSS